LDLAPTADETVIGETILVGERLLFIMEGDLTKLKRLYDMYKNLYGRHTNG
jgi:hypothetical protein